MLFFVLWKWLWITFRYCFMESVSFIAWTYYSVLLFFFFSAFIWFLLMLIFLKVFVLVSVFYKEPSFKYLVICKCSFNFKSEALKILLEVWVGGFCVGFSVSGADEPFHWKGPSLPIFVYFFPSTGHFLRENLLIFSCSCQEAYCWDYQGRVGNIWLEWGISPFTVSIFI